MWKYFSLAFLLCLFLFTSSTSLGQNQTGRITGTIVDKQSQLAVSGANIIVINHSLGAISDSLGRFTIEKVPVGRIDLQFSFIGYEPVIIRNLVVNSGKYLQVNTEMQEKVQELDNVIIRAVSKDRPLNPMAVVSARSFSMEETERYAGSLGDPSRMVANYAGVIVAGDQRNDIIIRGNSPLGLLWRLEGMNIPNPNHFGTMGTTGGPISILNNNQLANSDFYTGAFPSQYGNALSGVFDLRMRNGNTQKREYMAQMGMNGFELGAEGPLGKDSLASFMINYRYTMLKFMKALKIINVSGVPIYQDISSKIYLPTKKMGIFSFIILGGDSHIYVGEKGESSWTVELPGGTRAAYKSGMGVLGIHHSLFLPRQSRLENSLALTRSYSSNKVDTLRNGIFTDFYQENYGEYCLELSSTYYRKLDATNLVQSGISYDLYNMQYHDQVYSTRLHVFLKPTNTEAYTGLAQYYIQWKKSYTRNLSFTLGLHSQYLTLNGSFALEPRIGMRWNFAPKQTISLGYGLHSQMQPRLVYFLRTLTDSIILTTKETNRNLGFSRSHQYVFAYDWLLTENLRFKTELYYQHVFDIPVEQRPSYYSLANYGAQFYNSKVDSLVNKGLEHNYGIEFTVEKFLSSHYYYLLTLSLYESKYIGSDHIWRNSEFNGNFTLNALTGYEKQVRNSLLSFDVRTVLAGGKRYVPIDYISSLAQNKAVYDYSYAYENRFPDYFRLDMRFTWRINHRRISQEFAADIQNVTNHKNILTQDYNPANHTEAYSYQMGFFPVGTWRILF